MGLSKTHKRDFTASGYERKAGDSTPALQVNEENEDFVS